MMNTCILSSLSHVFGVCTALASSLSVTLSCRRVLLGQLVTAAASRSSVKQTTWCGVGGVEACSGAVSITSDSIIGCQRRRPALTLLA